MAGEYATESEAKDDDGVQAMLATIENQTRQTLELLRTLIGVVVPMVSKKDGPSLEELIATLVAQNRDVLTTTRRIAADVRVLSDLLTSNLDRKANGATAVNGTAVNGAIRS
jgi:hypothetical protein